MIQRKFSGSMVGYVDMALVGYGITGVEKLKNEINALGDRPGVVYELLNFLPTSL